MMDGCPAHVWSPKTQVVDKLRTHDFARAPFRLAANLRPGFYAPEVQYDVEVGTFRHCDYRHPQSDLNILFRVLRDLFPNMKLLVFATPPCRMTSSANTVTDPADKEVFVGHIAAVLKQLRFALEFGLVDDVVVEESCAAQVRGDQTCVLGEQGQRLLDALNCADRVTPPRFGVVKLDAADYGAPSTRKRVLFAQKDTLACLPRPADEWTGWGRVIGVSEKHSKLLLSGGTWRRQEGYSAFHASSPSHTLTQNPTTMCLDGTGDSPTLVDVDALERGLLLGCRYDDPKLRQLMALPRRLANTLTGITTCAQFDLAVVAASMQMTKCLADADTAFWAAERRRQALFPHPPRGWRVRWHKFLVKLKDGHLSRAQFEAELAKF